MLLRQSLALQLQELKGYAHPLQGPVSECLPFINMVLKLFMCYSMSEWLSSRVQECGCEFNSTPFLNVRTFITLDRNMGEIMYYIVYHSR